MMSPKSRGWSSAIAMPVLLATLPMAAAIGGASAQSSACGELQGHLMQRKSIAEKLSAGGKKQMDAKVACAGFTQLVVNGNTLLKWSEANKDWCQVPDSFIESMKADHAKAVSIKARACGVAAKQSQMEKQAKSGAGPGGGGLIGGGGLSGSSAMPQGAL